MTRLTRRLLSWTAPAATFGAMWGMTTTHVFTQTKTSSAPPLVITAYNGKTPATPFKSPKTPWSEPDLIGVWSSDDTAGLTIHTASSSSTGRRIAAARPPPPMAVAEGADVSGTAYS